VLTFQFIESAFDKDHPYYDEKSTKDDPKWFVVHVEFRHKFKELIKLKELQRFALLGGILDHMQMLKQSRLSVSKVSMKEWKFINTLGDLDEDAEPEYTTITVNTADAVNGK
jgi:predicted RNA-binding protein with PUA-like domain